MTAAVGAAAYVAGAALNTYGQSRALRAMRNAWADALARNSAFDAQLNARQQAAIGEINPQSVLGTAQAGELNGQMDASARNALAAIQAQAGRRNGNVEGRAVARQAQQGTLAELLRSGRLQATMHGLQQGGQNTQRVGQGLGIDARMIGDDARAWGGLAQLFERAAQMRGGWARRMGGALQGLGAAGMMAGMSKGQPEGQWDTEQQGVGGWEESGGTDSQARTFQSNLFGDDLANPMGN